eukprot:SAG11_NODE_7751_length_1101_cov_0.856287_2_plen_232_part_01
MKKLETMVGLHSAGLSPWDLHHMSTDGAAEDDDVLMPLPDSPPRATEASGTANGDGSTGIAHVYRELSFQTTSLESADRGMRGDRDGELNYEESSAARSDVQRSASAPAMFALETRVDSATVGDISPARQAGMDASPPQQTAAKKYRFNKQRQRWATHVNLVRNKSADEGESQASETEAEGEGEGERVGEGEGEGDTISVEIEDITEAGAFDFKDEYRPPVKFACQQWGLAE